MKVYVLVKNNEDGELSFDMDISYARRVRAYDTLGRAKAYAKRFNASIVEFDIEKGQKI